jgi:addiction module HigA family antidote
MSIVMGIAGARTTVICLRKGVEFDRLPLESSRKEYGDMPMKNPPHPGLSVRHDCLAPLGLSVTEAARRLGVSRKQLSDVVNGHAGISPEMAIRLDKAFGGGADTWFRLQAAYDLARAMKKANEIKVERIPRAA